MYGLLAARLYLLCIYCGWHVVRYDDGDEDDDSDGGGGDGDDNEEKDGGLYHAVDAY